MRKLPEVWGIPPSRCRLEKKINSSLGLESANAMVEKNPIKSTHTIVFQTVEQVSKMSQNLGKDLTPVVDILRSLSWVFVTRECVKINTRSEQWTKDRKRLESSLLKAILRVLSRVDGKNGEQKYVKYWHDRAFARSFRDVEKFPDPPSEYVEPLYSGYCLNRITRSVFNQDLAFLYSLQKGTKMIWPRLNNFCLNQSLEDHRKLLSTKVPPIAGETLEKIKKITRDVFSGFSYDGLYDKFLPSGRACSAVSLKNGGTLAMTTRFDVDGVLGATETKRLGKLQCLQHRVNSWRANNLALNRTQARRILGTENNENFLSVTAIAEPSKFRILTKGNGFVYNSLQPIQGDLISRWKKTTMSTMKHVDLTDRVAAMALYVRDNLLGEKYFWSVDYKAATDTLNVSATLAVGQALFPEDSIEYKSLLPGSRLIYPKIKGSKSDKSYPGQPESIMENGQLMGHPLSFPILCTINYCALYMACEDFLRENELDWDSHRTWYTGRNTFGQKTYASKLDTDLKKWVWNEVACVLDTVIVNGDDLLFRSCRRLFDLFMIRSGEMGFKPSPGKNYGSRNCAMINSQVFLLKEGIVKRIGYLNLRLIEGNNIKTGNGNNNPVMIASELNRMAVLTSWTAGAIKYPLIKWDEHFPIHKRPNWYLPVHLGGYGMDARFCNKFKITRFQRVLANWFIHNCNEQLFKCAVPLAIRKKRERVDRIFSPLTRSFSLSTRPYVPNKYETMVNISSCDAQVRSQLINRMEYGNNIVDRNEKFLPNPVVIRRKVAKDLGFPALSLKTIRDWLYAYKLGYNAPLRRPEKLLVKNCEAPDTISEEAKAGMFFHEGTTLEKYAVDSKDYKRNYLFQTIFSERCSRSEVPVVCRPVGLNPRYTPVYQNLLKRNCYFELSLGVV